MRAAGKELASRKENEVTIMGRTSLRGAIVGLIIFIIAPLWVIAAPVGKVTRVEGKVDVLKAGRSAASPVSQGDNVDVGDIYRSKTNSRAEITFFNKNIMRIAPATRVQVSQCSDEGNRSNQIMKLERGRVQAVSGEEFVKKVSSFAEGNKFEVHTPNAVAGIRGSGMTVGFAQMITGLFFSTGRGYFYNPITPGTIVNVSAGFMSFIVGTGGLPTRPVPGNVAYVGGTGGNFGLGGGGTSGNNLLNQNTSLDTSYVFNQQRVDIASVLVGSTNMSGSGAYVSLWFYDVKFFGPSVSTGPQTWSIGSVSGAVTGMSGTDSFGMSGTGPVSANVSISYGGGAWSATVSNGDAPHGIGNYKQPFTFSGTASGTFSTGTGSITGGTGSGNVP